MGKCIDEMVNKYKVDILAIGVHPDDIELACVGTLLKHIKSGYKVAIVDLTQGELGSRGSAELRLIEAKKAADIIGVAHRENLQMKDGFFEHSKINLIKIIEKIRKYQPSIVLANAVHDRHPDHGRAAKLVAEACFLSGLIKIETTDNSIAQRKWRPDNVYHYIQDYQLDPDFVIDITEFMDHKMEAILAYSSQFYNPNSEEVDTPISGKQFLDFVKAKARSFGRNIGVEFAEGFTVSREIGVKDLFDIY